MSVDFCGIELPHPIINASGTFDAIAAQRVFGRELLERFPFAAFVTKTVTVAARGDLSRSDGSTSPTVTVSFTISRAPSM